MQVNVCIPVLNNYSGLQECLDSVKNSSINVGGIYIIDNGGGLGAVDNALVHTPRTNIGVAASWNYFIKHVSEYRIICNDDVIFEKDSIEKMINDYNPDKMTFPFNGLDAFNAFSCFLLPQNIVNNVGLFDEKISPNYAYFEDNDYHRRMKLVGYDIQGCNTNVSHSGSATLKSFDANQSRRHHDKFRIAEKNYKKKWGGLPNHETLTVPKEL